MCALPLLSQLTAFKRWLVEVDTRFRKLHHYPISGILDKMVELLKISFIPNGQEAGVLSFTRLSRQRRENNRALAKGEFYELITKKRLFDLLELHYAQCKGVILANVGTRIIELDRDAPKALRNCVSNPGGLWGWRLGGNDISIGGKQGVSYYELMAAFRKKRNSKILPF